MYVYQQIIFDINIYTQKRSKSWSLFMSVPTVWRRGNKRRREPLNRWRRVHLEPSFWGGLSCYFLKAKLLSCTLKSPWMLISFSTGLMGCDWSESSEAITNDISWQTLFRFWWMNCWWYMRCSNQIMLQLFDVIGILIYWYKQVFEILGNIVTYLQQKTVLIWFTERYRCSILMFHIPAIKIKYIQHCFFNNAYIIDN